MNNNQLSVLLWIFDIFTYKEYIMLFFRSIALLIVFLSVNAYSHSDAYILSNSIWQTREINVCWESFNTSSQEQRSWVRSAVSRTWEKYSRVSFKGWGVCSSNGNGIRIAVNDEGPHVKALGKHLDGVKNGMVLNFTYLNWSPVCQYDKQGCSEKIAVHEFGHALGFAHEQNRDDTPTSCEQSPQGQNGDVKIGSWDLHSVMNYCNPEWNGNGLLSQTDIQAVVQYYKSKALVSSMYDDKPTFSADYYLRVNGDVAASYGSENYQAARNHWDQTGKYEGRKSAPGFHVKEYLALNPDLNAGYGTNYNQAINHFKAYGISEGRVSSYAFDVRDYLAIHSDLSSSYGSSGFLSAHNHWINFGLNEGRKSLHVFSIKVYLNKYSDIRNKLAENDYLGALDHYYVFGRNEGRTGN